jgi:hypothetical protein
MYTEACCIRQLQRQARGTYEFVRRLVFSVLIDNADMHSAAQDIFKTIDDQITKAISRTKAGMTAHGARKVGAQAP